MVRKGTLYTTSYSLDGSTWTTVWSTGATLNNTKVGVYSYSAAAAAGALTSSFDFFHVANPLGAPVTTATFAPPAVNGWFAAQPDRHPERRRQLGPRDRLDDLHGRRRLAAALHRAVHDQR